MAERPKTTTLLARPTSLDDPLDAIVAGPAIGSLAKDGVRTVEDLLRYYPRRYVASGELSSFGRLAEGEDATVIATIRSAETRSMRKRAGTYFQVTAEDDHGDRVTLTFFNFRAWHKTRYAPGTRGLFRGRFGTDKMGKPRLTHPEFHPFGGAAPEERIAQAYVEGLMPLYPERKGARSWDVGMAVCQVLDALGEVPDPLPEGVRLERGLVDLRQAFESIHRPAAQPDVTRARQRLVYEEAFVLQAELARRRAAVGGLAATPRAAVKGGLVDALDARLPFELTAGQREVGETILAELARPHPMHRLLQGEVGSGKTVVALRAMLAVVDAGGQAALLAPTEVLAHQHYRSIVELLGPLAEGGLLGGADVATRVAVVTGSLPAAIRRRTLLEVASGEAGIVVGTHALLEERVGFADLGLVVVDEQHRFGVEQRAALTSRNGQSPPHVLVMTATPIPRTVAMTVFGDLETSTLVERPVGRAPVRTVVAPLAERPELEDLAWTRIRERVADGHQAYVVCPRIAPEDKPDGAEDLSEPVEPEPDDRTWDDEPGEGPGDARGGDSGRGGERPLFGPGVRVEPGGRVDPGVRADRPREDSAPTTRPDPMTVVETVERLTAGPLAGLRVAALHGRMSSDEKDATMRRFAAGELDVLVATTVIEVGVDVANAAMMVILDADWYGVSQLHQLRGRIGRGDVPGLCLLVTRAAADAPSRVRLDAVAATTDGFELSRIDLAQRREGDVLGAAQHGRRSTLRMLEVLRHEDVIARAREDAVALIAEDPTLAAHPVLDAAIETSYGPDRAEYLEKT